MFQSGDAIRLSAVLRKNDQTLRRAVEAAFADAVPDQSREVKMLDDLLLQLKQRLEELSIPDVKFTRRFERVHQRPIVETTTFSCELADLLVAVKYRLPDLSVEQKSVLYQLKLTDSSRERYTIDQNQLTLLRDWPSFKFGRKTHGGPCEYRIRQIGKVIVHPYGLCGRHGIGSFQRRLLSPTLLPNARRKLQSPKCAKLPNMAQSVCPGWLFLFLLDFRSLSEIGSGSCRVATNNYKMRDESLTTNVKSH